MLSIINRNELYPAIYKEDETSWIDVFRNGVYDKKSHLSLSEEEVGMDNEEIIRTRANNRL